MWRQRSDRCQAILSHRAVLWRNKRGQGPVRVSDAGIVLLQELHGRAETDNGIDY
jgi:hypothetical protein